VHGSDTIRIVDALCRHVVVMELAVDGLHGLERGGGIDHGREG
jgi:hypothetical protein